MHVHILGICGTFMAGVAVLARQLGHTVSGSDANVYPPMSDVLREAQIALTEGYDARNLLPAPDLVVIGNALSRGNPEVEYVLNAGLPYRSGPAWIADNVLADRWVLAVSGTHGKTTTSALLAFVLEQAGMAPGFLIGGMVPDLGTSARLGRGPYFVIEADEYDTAFFDKRSKFVHYRPRTLVINNLEFDHADIFHDLAEIETQFHHLVRTVPAGGLIIRNAAAPAIDRVLTRGCWTPVETFGEDAGADHAIASLSPDFSRFEIRSAGRGACTVASPLVGRMNAENATAALAAAAHAGIDPAAAARSIGDFSGVKRRLEVIHDAGGIVVYDDFAHHPTAVAGTLSALRVRVGDARIVAVLEPRSNTMRMGVLKGALAAALAPADAVYVYRAPGLDWDPGDLAHPGLAVCDDVDALHTALVGNIRSGDHVVIMSNGAFGGLHRRLTDALADRAESA